MGDRTLGDRPEAATSSRRASATPPGETVLCEVFRSPRREGMYLYVERSEGLTRVPENLMERFGSPESALVFPLHGARRLARALATDVLKALAEQGFYLQMPPGPGVDRHDRAPDPGPGGERPRDPLAPAVTTRSDGEEPSC